MADSNPDQEVRASAETIVILEFGTGRLDEAFSSRKQALQWFRKWMGRLDANLQRHLILRTLTLEKSGWGLKVRFDEMQSAEVEMAGAAFSQLTGAGGKVRFLSEEEVAQQVVMNHVFKTKRQKLSSECGDFARTGAVIESLQKFFGNVGPRGATKRQKRAASASCELLNRAHRIGSSGLREARIEDEDADEVEGEDQRGTNLDA